MAFNGPIEEKCAVQKSNSSTSANFDSDVVVLGASIIDYTSYVPHLPRTGETLRATRLQNGFGGKAANQAVIAARLGSKTALISKLGNDDWADKYDENLKKHGVFTEYVTRVENKKTGVAQINVADNGDNQIVIIPGANDTMSEEDVHNANDLLSSAKVLICQFETPRNATMTALKAFRHGISILNASPAPSMTSLDLFSLPNILCVNQLEANIMIKKENPQNTFNIEAVKTLITNILDLGCRAVIITLGENGAAFASERDQRPIHVRAPKIAEVVDTTGAGDAFVGALAHFYAALPDTTLLQKVGGAVHIASMTVQKYGTQTSYPLGKDVKLDITQKKFDWSYM